MDKIMFAMEEHIYLCWYPSSTFIMPMWEKKNTKHIPKNFYRLWGFYPTYLLLLEKPSLSGDDIKIIIITCLTVLSGVLTIKSMSVDTSEMFSEKKKKKEKKDSNLLFQEAKQIQRVWSSWCTSWQKFLPLGNLRILSIA